MSGSTAAAPPTLEARTVAALWRDAAAQGRTFPAYLVEGEDGWSEVSWEEAASRVDELAHGLLALGVARGDRFAILGRTRLEWALLDWALISIGAVVVPVYETLSAREVAYILEHAGAVGVAVESDEQRAKVPELANVIRFDELDALAERGRAHAAEDPGAVERAAAAITGTDLLTIVYTSGTTGPPKGCPLTQRNYAAMVEMAGAISDFFEPADRTVLYLPLAHVFARLVHFSGASVGFTVAFCPDVSRLATALEQVRPTFIASVPRVFEKIHTAISSQFAEAHGVKRRLIDWALRVGRRASELRREGRPLPPALALQHRLAGRLVYSKVKARLGGKLRIAISGGAPLSAEIAQFFHDLDILILEGYGLSECSTAATVNRPDRYRFGTVGLPLEGCSVRIAEDGEILIAGENVFSGYYRDEAASAEVLTPDGWLRSGDIGEIDADGFVRITDRKKDIIVTAGGKNVAPQNVENELKASRYVSQALVVGDRRPYVAAVVTLEEPEIRKWAEASGVAGDLATLARDERVRALIQEAVDHANRDLARFEQVKRFAILPRDFSADEDEITPTLKLKRRICERHFADEIAALYDGSPKGV